MPPHSTALAEPLVVAEFWRNRRGESVRVQLREFEGQMLVDTRVHYTGKDGKLLPTKKGISIAVRRLPDLAAAINKALGKARELRGGPGCLNRFSASISGVSAGVRLPSGMAVG
jgi:hypothetical protein